MNKSHQINYKLVNHRIYKWFAVGLLLILISDLTAQKEEAKDELEPWESPIEKKKR